MFKMFCLIVLHLFSSDQNDFNTQLMKLSYKLAGANMAGQANRCDH